MPPIFFDEALGMIEQVKSLRKDFKKTSKEIQLEADLNDLLSMIAGQEADDGEEETDA